MNFKKLQAMQLELDNSILSAKPQMTAEERFNKTLVALSVEVAEVSNCSEHFKFWKDNKGKVDGERFVVGYAISESSERTCYEVNRNMNKITESQAHKLTLVEECSDALHFILSLANQLNVDIGLNFDKNNTLTLKTNEEYYLFLLNRIHLLKVRRWEDDLRITLYSFLGYIENLGITTQELEQAYYDKNKVNYERLREGY
ncbi:dUTP diphosphatase [Vagococcus fluvialis]|uniref:dUTP diphosphatase n=1 Tax=Vagococcus fluvialis TaxID=2738 RepID=UPI001D0A9A9B|nr:dUTP diphosphatase [Vagococcus fluvialis]UDM70679.1 dUTP diphosphatase [Vagococcus fluvialis]UDM78098.1 dUTP diphosphatase [Vagococcus fluvialis]UDM82367.1 dUTP diphosphatase [Vagococcus fluvialis]